MPYAVFKWYIRKIILFSMQNGPKTTIINEDGTPRDFTFDYSFWSHDGFRNREDGYSEPEGTKYHDQSYVFNVVRLHLFYFTLIQLGKSVLDSAWEGYNTCLFAYGQTGSGKSYSMVGYGANKGIVPMACDEIFRRIKENKDPEKTY